MKIVAIFEVVEESLYSIQFDQECIHEFGRLFQLWNDPMYLEEFFHEHQKDLNNSFWQGCTIEEAIIKTRKDAQVLEEKLLNIAKRGKINKYETLSTLFKPLHDNATKLTDYEKSKVKGLVKNSWLRICAIRVDVNLFIVAGGAIKLTKTMNERAHLLLELKKLEIVQDYLKTEEDDNLQFFELS